jgi:hypothetical protein
MNVHGICGNEELEALRAILLLLNQSFGYQGVVNAATYLVFFGG